MSAYTYSCFGLTIGSQLECPELSCATGTPDAYLRMGKTPEHLGDSWGEGTLYEAAPGLFLLRVPNVCRYLVRDGIEIVVDPIPGVDLSTVRLFLLGTALGALLYQRGFLPLHAGAIATPNGAMIFAGRSASGKSTLAAAFSKRGYRVLADELCAIRVDEISLVQPGIPHLLLWGDSLTNLGIGRADLRPMRPGLEKYWLPLGDAFARQAADVNTIFSLVRGGKREIRLLEGREKVMELAGVTYRRLFSANMKLSVTDSRKLKAIARQTQVFRLTWSDNPWCAEELADMAAAEFAL
ncbi:MAG TPA: hypothetical protein VKB79_22705 [Bryobacteraceae bacterium]|nr:hypothetical protein [Bryobacteraceae bacterium]